MQRLSVCYNPGAMYERLDLEPVRGMRDHLPADQEHLAATRAVLDDMLDRWGYGPIDTPVLERRELYLKKAGEELVSKLYDFVYQSRELALRPEWTASVLRAYLKHLKSEPLPLRLRYSGPVFRYERPQRVTYRQFTQVGVELIGGLAPWGDAEVVSLACRGLAAVGADAWTLTIGHVGVARALLTSLSLPERTASQLLWSMERLRRGRADEVREHLIATGVLTPPDESFDLGALVTLPDEQLASLLAASISTMGLSLANTSRPPDAVIEGLIRKLRRAEPAPRIEQALQSLQRLSQARGEPDEAFRIAEEVLSDLQIQTSAISELRQIIDLIKKTEGSPAEIIVDLGMSRGLHYYTGMIFEIEDRDGLQLCGGGRYDDLIDSLQGVSPGLTRNNIPAVGCAYGLERVAQHAKNISTVQRPALMVAAPATAYGRALDLAERLRNAGNRVMLDVRDRSVQANVRDAARRGYQAVIALDAEEDSVIWHELAAVGDTSRTRRMPIADLFREPLMPQSTHTPESSL